MQRCQRGFSGGDRPQIITTDVVGIVGKLRQLPRHGQGLGRNQRWWANLFKSIRIAIERKLAQCPSHRCPEPSLHGEHCPRDFHGTFSIQDAELNPGLPMRHPLMRCERRGHL